MPNRSDLTAYELNLLHKLEQVGHIKWIHCYTQEVRALNRLVKKGFAARSDDRETWTLKPELERIVKCQKQLR